VTRGSAPARRIELDVVAGEQVRRAGVPTPVGRAV
jgi:hypothetical protein